MRGGILAAGIILLILGIFFYYMGNNAINSGNAKIEEINKLNIYNLPISDVLMLLSPDLQALYSSGVQDIQSGQQLNMFGVIFGMVGLILCIAGIAAPSKRRIYTEPPASHQQPIIIQQTKPSSEPTYSSRHCPECGRSIPFDAKRCPYCEKDFEHNKIPKVEKKEATKIKEEKKSIEKKEFLQFCHDCGKKLDGDVDFCPYCGKKLNKLEEE